MQMQLTAVFALLMVVCVIPQVDEEVENCPSAFKKCLANVGLSHLPIAKDSIKHLIKESHPLMTTMRKWIPFFDDKPDLLLAFFTIFESLQTVAIALCTVAIYLSSFEDWRR